MCIHSGVTKGPGSMKTKEFIENMTKILSARPKLVLTIIENDQMTNLEYDESILFPWIVLTNNYKVTITCPGCGITHHGLWNKKVADKARGIGSFSKNLQQPVCCDMLKEKKIRMTSFFYHRKGNMHERWKVDSVLVDLFIQKYQLESEFIEVIYTNRK